MRTIFFLGLVVLCSSAVAQQKGETVTVNLDQNSFTTTEWPFDIAFVITGTRPANVINITMNYKIADAATRGKKWISLPKASDTNPATGYLKTPVPNGSTQDSTKFSFLCEGLHPNIKYTVRFELTKRVTLPEKLVTEMRGKLADRLRLFFKQHINTKITIASLRAENAVLFAIVKSYFPDKNLYFKNNPSKVYTYNAFGLNQASSTTLIQSGALNDANTRYKTDIGNMVRDFDSKRSEVLADIDAIQSGKMKMNRYSKEVLALPFNPGLPNFKSYTLLDGIKLLRQMALPNSQLLKNLLEGTVQISNNSLVSGDGNYQSEAILFISSLLRELKSGVLKDSVMVVVNKKKVLQEQSRFTYLPGTMTATLGSIDFQVPKMAHAREELAKIESLLPDILASIVQIEALEVSLTSEVDVLTEKTPYISAEAGLGYVQAFRSTMHYRGANIYFTPINKRATLGKFKGMNRVWKSLSMQVGICNFFGDRPLNTYSLLGKGASTHLNLALGWRLNRIIKVNAGVIPYKTNNFNAIGDQTKLRGAGYLSIGLDVNLLKALGDVATIFNL